MRVHARAVRVRGRVLPSRARARTSAGFTLIELLLVIGLIALIMGVGLGAIMRLDTGDRVALPQVQNTLRAARNWAVARSAPARVRIDKAQGTLRAEGLQVIGTWRFEDESLDGALELDGANLGGHLDEHGFHGKAFSFAGERSPAKIEFAVQRDPASALREGFRIACAVRLEPDGGGALLALDESAGIDVAENGAVTAWFAPEIQNELGEQTRGGRVTIATAPGLLRPGRWSEIEVEYDRREFSLDVDRVRAAVYREDAPVWKAEGPLVVSPGRQAFGGAIDDLVFATVQVGELVQLPVKIKFAKTTPAEIRFVAGGALDRQLHREPIAVTLEHDDGRTQAVRVNFLGTVE